VNRLGLRISSGENRGVARPPRNLRDPLTPRYCILRGYETEVGFHSPGDAREAR
jgi:hypothetical protein